MTFLRPGHVQKAFVLCIVFVLSLAVWAQTGTTGIQGQVTDRTGAAISSAKVVITNTATGAERTDTTDATGNYAFTSLAPGTYRLRVEAPGFRSVLHENLQLLVNSPIRFNVPMQVGATQETVEVTAAAERLNTVDASVGNAFEESQIKQLPLEGRNVVGLLSLQPGAVYLPVPPTSSDNDPRSGSIAGSHSDQTNVTMDGVDVNDAQNGYAYTSVLRATLDSVQEFRVTTTNYGADQGRSSGAQVSLVTKSGSNTPHGSAYWYHRNTAFSSNEFFNKLSQYDAWQQALQEDPNASWDKYNRAPKLQKHIYGASFGFAPIKDRLFLFGNFENLRLSSQSSETRWVPSQTMRDGILVYECADPAQCPGGTVNGFNASHVIPAGYNAVNPAQLTALDPLGFGPSASLSQYFNQFPTPNSIGRDGALINGQLIGNIVGYRFASPLKNSYWTYITRVDYKLDHNGNHQLMWRGNLQNDRENASAQYCFQDGTCTPPRYVTAGNNRGMMVGYTGAITPHLVNNFRYGYTRVGSGRSASLNSDYVTVRFIDMIDPLYSSRNRIIPTHNFTDDITWNKGKHTMQFGANLRFTRVNTADNENSYRYVSMNGSWVAGNGTNYLPGDCPSAACQSLPLVSDNSLASYADSWIDILGVLSEAGATYNYNRQGQPIDFGVPIKRTWGNNGYEFYFQDNWRIKPNFNIVAGLRWTYSSPPWETHGLQVAPTTPLGDWFNLRWQYMLEGKPANAVPRVQFDWAGKANGKTGFYENDFNNFGPRFAFTYSPQWNEGWLKKLTGGANKTVIRGGYGMVFDQVGLGLATQFDRVGAFGLATNLESGWHRTNEDTPGARFVNLTTVPDTIPAAPPAVFPVEPPTFAGQITSAMDSTIRTPYSQMINFFIGRELPGKMTLDLGYVGRRASRVLARRDLAMPFNLYDPGSKTDYYTAVRQLIDALAANGQDYTAVPAIPFFENVFPTGAAVMGTANNTQAVAYQFADMAGDWTSAMYELDEWGETDGYFYSKFGQFAFFDPQYDALAAISSVGRAKYDSLQVSLRRAYANGLQFDANYTYSKAMDHSSAVERGSFWTDYGGSFYSNFLVNSWNPRESFGTSDFDVRHQFNFNYVADLPFGKGRRFGGGAKGFLNALVGGWQTTGIVRVTSGFPWDIINCRSCWPTNWNLQGNTQFSDLAAVRALQGHTLGVASGGYPSPFKDPAKVLDYVRRAYPGEGGARNRIRGDGYFTWDVSMGKDFTMPYSEAHKLRFRWEIFNLTNTARFNVADITAYPDLTGSFGSYQSTLSGCDNAAGRCMQVSLRYEF